MNRTGLLSRLAGFLGTRSDKGERPRWATIGLYAASGYLLYTGHVGYGTALLGIARGTQTIDDAARDYIASRAQQPTQ